MFTSKVDRLIRQQTWVVIQKCPNLCKDDVHQDMWVETLKAWNNFRQSENTQFTTFLFKHLTYRSLNMVKSYYRQHKFELEFAFLQQAIYEFHEESMQLLCEKISEHLNEKEQKIFKQFVDPDKCLVEAGIRECNSGTLKQEWTKKQLASYLNLTQISFSRTFVKIKSAINKHV